MSRQDEQVSFANEMNKRDEVMRIIADAETARNMTLRVASRARQCAVSSKKEEMSCFFDGTVLVQVPACAD